MKTTLIAITLSLQILATMAQSGGTVKYVDGSYASLKGTAAQQGRQMVVIVGVDWCGHCQNLYGQIMTNPKVVTEFSQYLVARYDAEKGADGIEVARLFDVKRYPMLIILTPQGDEIGRMVGIERSADTFLTKFRDAALGKRVE